jgi:hypothetical protein
MVPSDRYHPGGWEGGPEDDPLIRQMMSRVEVAVACSNRTLIHVTFYRTTALALPLMTYINVELAEPMMGWTWGKFFPLLRLLCLGNVHTRMTMKHFFLWDRAVFLRKDWLDHRSSDSLRKADLAPRSAQPSPVSLVHSLVIVVDPGS